MGRLHLVELEDYPWFPPVIRDGATAFLRAIGRVAGYGQAIAPMVADVLRKTGHRRIIDLCSGGAGPLPELLSALAKDGLEVRAVLTDKYPNFPALEQAASESDGRIHFSTQSIDATDVPRNMKGFRTLFNALHHFPPELARGILADAVRKRTPIGVFEMVERTAFSMGGICLSPLAVLALMPTIRPLRPAWWALTYLLPLIPGLILFDGLVSCVRVYSPKELWGLIRSIDGHETFEWRIERAIVFPIPGRATILLGMPKE